jgi:DNA-binding XRE family transcriptional regulator
MSMVDVTDVVLNEEFQEMQEILNKNPAARKSLEQFEAECKIRRELLNARKQKKITQSELQEISGLTQQTISRIETNNDISPSLTNLIRYVNAIGYEIVLQPKDGY